MFGRCKLSVSLELNVTSRDSFYVLFKYLTSLSLGLFIHSFTFFFYCQNSLTLILFFLYIVVDFVIH